MLLHTHETLGAFLAKRFFVLSAYAQRAMERALGMAPRARPPRTSSDSASSSAEPSPGLSSPAEPTPPAGAAFPQELDVMLPKACEALVLVAQCIITISLEAEEQQARLDGGESTYAAFTNMKGYYAHKRHDGEGLVESLIGMHTIAFPRNCGLMTADGQSYCTSSTSSSRASSLASP